jgi:protein phosphatase
MTTRVAILADIHGNIEALRAVLSDVTRHAPDMSIFAGDLAMGGADPEAVIAQVQALQAPAILGNGEMDIINASHSAAVWTAERIGTAGVDFLRTLPFSHRITPPNGTSPENDLLIVHATPRDCLDFLLLEQSPSNTAIPVTPEHEAIEMLCGEKADLIVYGHIHIPSKGIVVGQRVVSVGSIGFPFDKDHRAAYAIATWENNTWEIQHHRVAYDYEQAAQKLDQSDNPFALRSAAMIRAADWVPRSY